MEPRPERKGPYFNKGDSVSYYGKKAIVSAIDAGRVIGIDMVDGEEHVHNSRGLTVQHSKTEKA